jgi:hypothetical protein
MCINKVAIIHESTIFDKRRARFMSELNTIRSRALKISSISQKENKRIKSINDKTHNNIA